MIEQVKLIFGSEDRVSATVKTIRGELLKLAGAYVGVQGLRELGRFAGEALAEYSQSEKALAQLDQTLRSTGHGAGLTGTALRDLASDLAKTSLYEDDAIVKSEALLLTFTKVGKEIFPQAQRAILDVAQAMGTDLQGATIQIGKALQDPIQGVTALRRTGIQLSEQQQDQIKQFMAVNDVASAQKIILQELATQFGGQSKAAADTLSGRINNLKKTMGELKEEIGFLVADTLELVGAIGKGDETGWFDGLVESMGEFREAGGGAREVLSAIAQSIMAMQGAGTPVTPMGVLAQQAGEAQARVEELMTAIPAAEAWAAIAPPDQINAAIARVQALREELWSLAPPVDLAAFGAGLQTPTQTGPAADEIFDIPDMEDAVQQWRNLQSEALAQAEADSAEAVYRLIDDQRKLREGKEAEAEKAFEFLLEDQERTRNAVDELRDYRLSLQETDRQSLERWYAEQLEAWEGNQAALTEIQAIYAEERKRIAQDEVEVGLGAMSDFFGGIAELAKAGGRRQFDLWKTTAVAQAVISAYLAFSKALASGVPPWSYFAAAAALATGMANVSRIASTKPPQAHAGLTDVPETATYILRAGERVLAPEQNRDLTTFLKAQAGAGRATFQPGAIQISVAGSSPQEVEALVIDRVIPALQKAIRQGLLTIPQKQLVGA